MLKFIINPIFGLNKFFCADFDDRGNLLVLRYFLYFRMCLLTLAVDAQPLEEN